jgi:hypothetical protein
MSDNCCKIPAQPDVARECPSSGTVGKPVDWLTVASLVRGPVPPRQEFWLCRDPDCQIVYFGSAGEVLEASRLRVTPGFKSGSDGLVCYCFEHRKDDIARDLADKGETGILESIRIEVQAGNCACEVRNPSGKCCLGDVQRTINEMKQETVVAP